MNNNYKEYLKSNEWKEIKSLVLKRDGNKCIKCGNTNNLQVHHTTYSNIFNEAENLNDLITLCGKCHMEEHNIEVCKNDDFILKVSNNFIMQEAKMKPSEYILYLNLIKLIQKSNLKYRYYISRCDIVGLLNSQSYRKSNLDKIIDGMIKNQIDEIIYDVEYNGKSIVFNLNMDNFVKYFNIDDNYSYINLYDFCGLGGTQTIKIMMLISRFSKNGWIKIKEEYIRLLLNKSDVGIKTWVLNKDLKYIVSKLSGKFKIKSFKITKIDNENMYEFTFNKFNNTIGGNK